MVTMLTNSAISNDDYRGPRTFTSAVAVCLRRYFQFSGRAPRSEFWYFQLFATLVGIMAIVLDAAIFGTSTEDEGPFSIISGLFFFIPSLAVLIRRLHDIDRSGWWWLLLLIPLIGWIIVLIWLCTHGTLGPNQYGPDPLAVHDGSDVRVRPAG